MFQPILNDSQTVATAASVAATGVSLANGIGYCVTNVVTVTTPAAGAFTALATTDVCTKTTHGMLTGLKVQVSNAGGDLPTGLSAATDYFVIKVTADTFKLATTLVNAQAGTAIDLTTDGTGTQTVTPTALAGASVKLQASFDDITYIDLGVSSNITATANFIFEKVDPMFNYVRCYYTLTAGQISSVQNTLVKG